MPEVSSRPLGTGVGAHARVVRIAGPRVVVPLILVVVAVAQISTATCGTLSSWKGGGFGMFASLDGPANRSLFLSAVDFEGKTYFISPPFGRVYGRDEFQATFASKLQIFPTEASATRLARALFASDLVLSPEGRRPLSPRLELSSRGALFRQQEPWRALEVMGLRRSDRAVELRQVRVAVIRADYDVVANAAVQRVILAAVAGN